VLLTLLWAEGVDQIANSHLLLLLDHSNDLWLVISVNECKKLVQNLRNRLLVNVLQKVLNDGGLLGKDEWEQLLLLSADQQGDQLAEVTREDWVEVLVTSLLDELEQSLEEQVFVALFFVIFLFFWGILSLEGGGCGSHLVSSGLLGSWLFGSFLLFWLGLGLWLGLSRGFSFDNWLW
jgi:hypothetical protein